jgi:hypothetical protein
MRTRHDRLIKHKAKVVPPVPPAPLVDARILADQTLGVAAFVNCLGRRVYGLQTPRDRGREGARCRRHLWRTGFWSEPEQLFGTYQCLPRRRKLRRDADDARE